MFDTFLLTLNTTPLSNFFFTNKGGCLKSRFNFPDFIFLWLKVQKNALLLWVKQKSVVPIAISRKCHSKIRFDLYWLVLLYSLKPEEVRASVHREDSSWWFVTHVVVLKSFRKKQILSRGILIVKTVPLISKPSLRFSFTCSWIFCSSGNPLLEFLAQ